MSILFTCFNGKNNSSCLLVDKINSNNKLYLKNSFITSVKELEKELVKNNYDLIISFGQADIEIDTIKIELIGRGEIEFITNYNYSNIINKLELYGYRVLISKDAGNYLCNNLYYNGLKYISDNNINTKMIFIHIPKIKNISDIYMLASVFNSF